MDRSIGSPRTLSVVGVRGPGVSVFGLLQREMCYITDGEAPSPFRRHFDTKVNPFIYPPRKILPLSHTHSSTYPFSIGLN